MTGIRRVSVSALSPNRTESRMIQTLQKSKTSPKSNRFFLSPMGNAKNLKLGATESNFLCEGQMSTLFNCCVHQKDV